MKIQSIHFHDVGPLGDRDIKLKSDWDGEVETLVLLSGPNGCGKSTVLRAAAMLWEALGHWLTSRKTLPKSHAAREWLQRWGGCAMVLGDAPADGQLVGLVFGDLQWCEELRTRMPDVQWIGEGVARTGKPGNPKREVFLPEGEWLNRWSEARKRLVLTFERADIPNIIFLDAEERRWVAARRNVGDLAAESPARRWLPRHVASDDWKDQLEASLITLKTTQLHKYHEVLRLMNGFLAGKEIEPDIQQGEGRLRVKLKGRRGQHHTLDELSAGEHQVLILLFLVAHWAEPGAVVMIDEPDLYLHPSLINGLLASLEGLVAKLGGQLLITSHQPDVWQRYEASGQRVELGAAQ